MRHKRYGIAKFLSVAILATIAGIFPPITSAALAQTTTPGFAGSGLTVSFAAASSGFAADGLTMAFQQSDANFAGTGMTIAFQNAITLANGQGFTVGFGSAPNITSLLGQAPQVNFNADPINTATGNYVFQYTDLSMPGRGMSLEFARSYNSLDPTGGPLGFGWTHNYNITLALSSSDSSIAVHWDDGHADIYDLVSGVYQPRFNGIFDKLVKNSNGTYTVTQKDQRQFNFNVTGAVISIVDRNGNTLLLTYESDGKLNSIIDTVGRNVTLAYDSSGRIIRVIDPLPRTISFSYDSNGNLSSSTDPNGGTTTYSYDSNHRMLTAVDARGNTFVTNVYDDAGRVIRQSDAKGNTYQYAYRSTGCKDAQTIIQTRIADPAGNTSIDSYDARCRLIRAEDRLGSGETFTYDDKNNRTSASDKNEQTTNYLYDDRGNALIKVDALRVETQFSHDALDNPTSRTGQGSDIHYEFDSKGNRVAIIDPSGRTRRFMYDSFGQVLTETDFDGRLTKFSYDDKGNLTSVTDALGNTTTYSYDAIGRRISIIDARGNVTRYTYDLADRVTSVTDAAGGLTQYEYDPNGNRIKTIDAEGRITQTTYDANNLLVTTRDAVGAVIRYTYDKLGNQKTITDALGNVTMFEYDSESRLVRITDALASTTQYTYDRQGDRTTTTNALGNTTKYEYDALNRLVKTTDPLGNAFVTDYNQRGEVVGMRNALNRAKGIERDNRGLVLSVAAASDNIIAYGYDGRGNRTSVTDPNGNVYLSVLDAADRLVQSTAPLGGKQVHTYDALGNKSSLTDPAGNKLEYRYDELNRLTAIKYPDGFEETFAYDKVGNRIGMVDRLGTSAYQFDGANRLVRYADPFGNVVQFSYDLNGNKTSITYPAGKILKYGYDAVNRLIRVEDWIGQITQYSYDAANRLVRVSYSNGTSGEYEYDAAGRVTHFENARPNGSAISSYDFTPDAVGHHVAARIVEPLLANFTPRTHSIAVDSENRIVSFDDSPATYDANGNLTRIGADIFAYDFEDRLVTWTRSARRIDYQYDASGNRLVKNVSGKVVRYIYDVSGRLPQIIAEADSNGAIVAYYVYGLGLISRITPGGNSTFYHYDFRGSTIGITDASANIVVTYAYDPFGSAISSADAEWNPFRFLGRYGAIDDGGILQIRARYYVPDLGRFLTKDSDTPDLLDSQSWNRYSYTSNEPITSIDIDGRGIISWANDQIGQLSDSVYGSVNRVWRQSKQAFEEGKAKAKAAWQQAKVAANELWQRARFYTPLVVQLPSAASELITQHLPLPVIGKGYDFCGNDRLSSQVFGTDRLPGVFNFAQACALHDACYDTLGKEGKQQCDARFGEALDAECSNSSNPALCSYYARTYHGLVLKYGDPEGEKRLSPDTVTRHSYQLFNMTYPPRTPGRPPLFLRTPVGAKEK